MDDFRDLMYDLIIESLVDKLDNYEITMEDVQIISEAAYDELYSESLLGKIKEKFSKKVKKDENVKKEVYKPFSGKLRNCELVNYGKEELDIINNKDLILAIQKIYPKAEKLMYKEIDKMYNNWYDDEDNRYTLSDVKKMMDNLLDTVVVRYSNKFNIIVIEYCVNNYCNHRLSNEFFGNHMLTCAITIDKNTYQVKQIEGVSLEG